MKEYFGNNVTCVYLDQFAASNLFDNPPNDLWLKISQLLLNKHKDGKVICPLPFEHLLETANKIKEDALLTDSQFHLLSNGWAFLPEANAAANYITCTIRKLPITKTTFFGQLRYSNTLAQKGAYDGFRAKHRLLASQVSEIVAGQNDLWKVLAQKCFPKSVMEPMFQACKLMQVQPFLGRLVELINKGHIVSQGVDFEGSSVIVWTDLLLQLLLWEHKLDYSEGHQLRDLICQSGFDLIPPLEIRVSLTANLAIEHKKETINDQIDIMRLSAGLPASDFLFTDKQRKFELLQTGLAANYQTEVFNGTNSDLELFYERLHQL